MNRLKLNGFKHLSIKHQLIIILILISFLSLSISISITIVSSTKLVKNDFIKSTKLQTQLIAQYCITPLIFNDNRGARDILLKLTNLPSIKNAILFNKKNDVFAKYNMSNKKLKTYDLKEYIDKNGKIINNNYYLILPIKFKNNLLGNILVIASTKSLIRNRNFIILNNIFILVFALFIAYLISIKLQKLLSHPILELTNIIQEITLSDNYNKTLEPLTKYNKETGMLYNSFKIMIDRINERQERLNQLIKALKNSEAKYKRFFDHNVSAILILSKTGKILDCNLTLLDLLGFDDKSKVFKYNFKNFCKSKDCFNNLIKEIKKNQKIINKEIEMLSHDNKSLNILANLFIEKEEKEERIIVYLFDITQRKYFEQQFMHSQKMASLGTFVGGIAHDFNNILTVIKGYADMMFKSLDKKNRLYNKVKIIKETTHKAENLIKKLLFLSKKKLTKTEIFNLNEIIIDLKPILTKLIGENIKLTTELDENLPDIKADHSQIEQIILNLVANSRDALNETNKKNKEILIKTDQIYVKNDSNDNLNLLKKGNNVILSISDNGIGMDEDVKNKAFEPFFTTKDKTKGTGLGLSTVYAIITQNNAKINIYSEKNIGTTVKIYFQEYFEKSENNKEKDSEINIKHFEHLKNKHILVVEDDDNVRNFAISVLEDLGYKVSFKENGKKALEFIKNNNHIDMIITDVIMPEMNGVELISKVKDIYPHIKVIFTSGYTDGYLFNKENIDKKINFLQKPYSYDSLSEIVSIVINKK